MSLSVSTARPARRRSKKDQAHDVELAQLATNAAQIRYACEIVSQQPEPLTVQAVRTWLVEHGVADNLADDNRRSYVSRAVNEWRREHGLHDTGETTPDSETPAEPPQAEHPNAGDVARHVERDVTSAGSGPIALPDVHTDRDPVRDVTRDLNRDVTRDLDRDVTSADSGPITLPERPAAEHAGVHPNPVPDVHTDRDPVRDVTRDLDPSATRPDHVHAELSESTPHTAAGSVAPHLVARSRRLRFASYLVLSAVAAAGAALSYQSLETAAQEVFPKDLARVFPLLVDALIVGASLAYLAGAVVGRGRAGWRLTAHVGVGGTIFLNALAAESLVTVPWHIAAPIVWAALVELTARDLLGDYRAVHARPDSIPFALWLTAPGESAATWLRVRRQAAHASVRVDVGAHAAAREALRMALPGRQARQVRRVISRQLRAGSVTPSAVVAQAVAIMGDVPAASAKAVLRDVLTSAVGVPAAEKPAPLMHTPQISPSRSSCGLVRARPQDIDQLRTAIHGHHHNGSESSPNKPTRNPYINLTPEPEPAPQLPSQEPNQHSPKNQPPVSNQPSTNNQQ